MHNGGMGSRSIWMVLFFVSTVPLAGRAELRPADLALPRQVTQRDWLKLKLEVLGQRLSFPAYRIRMTLDSQERIAFALLASSGLAKQLTEETERSEAEQILSYHANGIRQQVEDLLRGEFPILWERYDARRDFHGEFLGPGPKWDDPPAVFCRWREGNLQWEH